MVCKDDEEYFFWGSGEKVVIRAILSINKKTHQTFV